MESAAMKMNFSQN